jgi:hypothetical protein
MVGQKREARLFITKARSASFHHKSAKRVFHHKSAKRVFSSNDRAIHGSSVAAVAKDVDARDKRAHDDANNCS